MHTHTHTHSFSVALRALLQRCRGGTSIYIMCVCVCVCVCVYTTHTIQYYSAVGKMKILSFVTTWMVLEDFMLNEIREIEKTNTIWLSLLGKRQTNRVYKNCCQGLVGGWIGREASKSIQISATR